LFRISTIFFPAPPEPMDFDFGITGLLANFNGSQNFLMRF
jgi:hypothetical protein